MTLRNPPLASARGTVVWCVNFVWKIAGFNLAVKLTTENFVGVCEENAFAAAPVARSLGNLLNVEYSLCSLLAA